MNLYLYGFGRPHSRKWLMVDLGITFAGEREPGIDIVYPDIRFIEEERANLVGLVLTHAHEDHYGAVTELWPRLQVDVYATPFTAGLLRAKIAENGVRETIPIREVPLQAKFSLGPFDLELVNVAHSIPEPNGVVIRTQAGSVFHTGDWKIDPKPVIGPPTDGERISQLRDEGVDAIVCDSTNAFRGGVSPSESDVAESLTELIAESKHRVAVTTFASNVARMKSVIEAADAAGRSVVIVGRAMQRVTHVARETGYLSEDIPLLGEASFKELPRNNVLTLCTGSQGEPRGAVSRISRGEHPKVRFTAGDRIIFSSRPIPGNDKAIVGVQNDLAERGIEVITDSDALVHVSGHPRRDELDQMYDWLRPSIAVPVHGEPRHLLAHAEFARSKGVRDVIPARNGSLVRLAPGPAKIVDDVPVGRLHMDGRLLIDAGAHSLRDRRKLGFVGSISVSIVLTQKGELVADPEIMSFGLPGIDDCDIDLEDIAVEGALGALDGIPRPRRKDDGLVREAVRRGVRAAVGQAWGKRPLCAVLVTRV